MYSKVVRMYELSSEQGTAVARRLQPSRATAV